MSATIKFDRSEFDRTLREYRRLSKRDPETITNTKGFYIARRATIETEKRTKADIRGDLMAMGRKGVAIAVLIVNATRKKMGLPGLYGSKMKEAVAKLIKGRRVASIAAGWIPAIKALEPLAEKRGAPRQASQAKAVDTGIVRGYAKPAVGQGLKAKTVIANLMQAQWDTREGAEKVATPGLEKAFQFETQSMREYIERKYRETAQAAGIKTN